MRIRWLLGCVVWCVISSARADGGGPPGAVPATASAAPASDEPVEIESYRLPLGVADAASILVVIFGAASDSDRAPLVGAGSFVLTGPILHAVHGHGTRAAVSMALRVGLPLGGALLGERLGRNSHYRCDFDEICDRSGEDASLFLFLGMVAAAVIDEVAVAQPVEIHAPPASLSWAPRFSAAPHQASVGIAGRF